MHVYAMEIAKLRGIRIGEDGLGGNGYAGRDGGQRERQGEK